MDCWLLELQPLEEHGGWVQVRVLRHHLHGRSTQVAPVEAPLIVVSVPYAVLPLLHVTVWPRQPRELITTVPR